MAGKAAECIVVAGVVAVGEKGSSQSLGELESQSAVAMMAAVGSYQMAAAAAAAATERTADLLLC